MGLCGLSGCEVGFGEFSICEVGFFGLGWKL